MIKRGCFWHSLFVLKGDESSNYFLPGCGFLAGTSSKCAIRASRMNDFSFWWGEFLSICCLLSINLLSLLYKSSQLVTKALQRASMLSNSFFLRIRDSICFKAFISVASVGGFSGSKIILAISSTVSSGSSPFFFFWLFSKFEVKGETVDDASSRRQISRKSRVGCIVPALLQSVFDLSKLIPFPDE